MKGEHHRLFPHFGREGGREDGEKKTVFVLSGEESAEVFQLDTVFFQNWYGYQDRFVSEGKGPSLVQVMSVSFSPFPLFFSVFFFSFLLASITIIRRPFFSDPYSIYCYGDGLILFLGHRCLTPVRRTCRCRRGSPSAGHYRGWRGS